MQQELEMIAAAAKVEFYAPKPAGLSPAMLRSVRVGSIGHVSRTVRNPTPARPQPIEHDRRPVIDEEPERWDGMS